MKSPAHVISIKLVPDGAQGKLHNVIFRILRRCKINNSSSSLPLSSIKLVFQSGLWALESIPMSALLLWKIGWLNKGVNNSAKWVMVGLQ